MYDYTERMKEFGMVTGARQVGFIGMQESPLMARNMGGNQMGSGIVGQGRGQAQQGNMFVPQGMNQQGNSTFLQNNNMVGSQLQPNQTQVFPNNNTTTNTMYPNPSNPVFPSH